MWTRHGALRSSFLLGMCAGFAVAGLQWLLNPAANVPQGFQLQERLRALVRPCAGCLLGSRIIGNT